jgi:glycosyltransferase involved in cell wall biosynthesis
MRITLVIAGLGGGGAERVAVNLANAWAKRGYEPTILTISQNSQAPAYEVDAAVELRDLGWPRSAREYELNPTAAAPILRAFRANDYTELIPDLTMLALLRFAILSTEPDVVVSFITQTNIRVLAAMHESKVPVIVCEVTDARRVSLPGWQRARGLFYRRATAVVAPEPAIAEWLVSRGIRAIAIHNPLVAPSVPIALRANSRRRVVTLSRLSSEKRPDWLLRAFASVAERYPDWDLEVYGFGPQRNFLEHLAGDLAPAGRIRFCGFSTDPYGVLAGADIFVSASWVEGFGNAIWEALACGVPVVAMDAGPSVNRIVRHEVDGLIVKENSVAGLAAALERLMGDEAERRKFASRAPEVIDRFSMQAALKQWDNLLALSHTR